MCCYTRHLQDQMLAAGIPNDRGGRQEADRRLRATLELPAADCPDVWRRVKALTPGEVAAMLRDPQREGDGAR